MNKRLKTALFKTGKILFAGFVVLVLLVAAGLAYTWWMGQQPTVPVEQAEVAEAPRPATVQTRTVAEDAPIGVSSQLLTSPVQPGENASLTVKTNPNAECAVTVTYGKAGDISAQSTDSGLRPRVADAYGMTTWTWTVESSRPLGSWPVEVTCANAKNSAYLRVMLDVATEST